MLSIFITYYMNRYVHDIYTLLDRLDYIVK